MDCFQDFCLFCDRESPDGHYCSQACKLADLERSGPCEASSPMDRTPLPTRGASTHPLITNLPNNNQSHTSPQSSTSSSPQYSSSPERQLTPSSSRSSLSSASSLWAASSPTDALSAQARHDLHDYFSSFDQVRAAKRRSSLR